ncbi:MAG: hypothetical protein AAGK21_11505 [Bacteroidota bacterium]
MHVLRRVLLIVLAVGIAACDSTGEAGPPRSASILKVTVTDAPLVDPVNGDPWDGGGGGGPEVYFRLFDASRDYVTDPGADRLNPRDDLDLVFAQGSTQPWFDDIDALTFPLVWDVDPGYDVRRLDDELYIALFDYDPTTGDDPMAASEPFRLADIAPDIADGAIDTITLDGVDVTGSPVAFEVRLSVVFED